MSGNKFSPGDLVQLKSGGPKMTVEKAAGGFGGDSTTYFCTWFSGAKHNKHGFSEEALQVFSEDNE